MEDYEHEQHGGAADRKYTFEQAWSWLRERGNSRLSYDYESEGPRDVFNRVRGEFWAAAEETKGRKILRISPKGSFLGGLGPDALEIEACCWSWDLNPEHPFCELLGDDPCHYLDYALIGLVTGKVRVDSAPRTS